MGYICSAPFFPTLKCTYNKLKLNPAREKLQMRYKARKGVASSTFTNTKTTRICYPCCSPSNLLSCKVDSSKKACCFDHHYHYHRKKTTTDECTDNLLLHGSASEKKYFCYQNTTCMHFKVAPNTTARHPDIKKNYIYTDRYKATKILMF